MEHHGENHREHHRENTFRDTRHNSHTRTHIYTCNTNTNTHKYTHASKKKQSVMENPTNGANRDELGERGEQCEVKKERSQTKVRCKG